MTLFKKNVATLAMGAALLVSAQANAAEDLTLKVSGTIMPAACTPTLSNSGEISFGSIAASSVRKPASGSTLAQLGAKDMTLTVKCDASTALGFKMMDNRAGTAVALSSTAYINSPFTNGPNVSQSVYGFGLGVAVDDAKIGAYTVGVTDQGLTADGQAASLIGSADEGKSWQKVVGGYQTTNNELIFTVSALGTSEPKLFQEMSMPLGIGAAVDPNAVLGAEEVILNGNATLSLVYL